MIRTFIFSNKFLLKNWYIIDAKNQILGRLSSQLTSILLMKHKKYVTSFLPSFTKLIIININKIAISGNKAIKKLYKSFSGYPSGLSLKTFLSIKYKNSCQLMRLAIKGMLPKTRRRKILLSDLYLYKNTNFCEKAQTPISLFKIK